MQRDERYENLERLRRDADEIVGAAYDAATGLSFLFWWAALWLGGMIVANKLFGGDAPDLVDYGLVFGSAGLLIWICRRVL